MGASVSLLTAPPLPHHAEEQSQRGPLPQVLGDGSLDGFWCQLVHEADQGGRVGEGGRAEGGYGWAHDGILPLRRSGMRH
jgi:hypothetical protein